MVLFELCQKRVIRDFFVQDEKIQAFLRGLSKGTFSRLLQKKSPSPALVHDFLNFGHILSNRLVRDSIRPDVQRDYLELLNHLINLEKANLSQRREGV